MAERSVSDLMIPIEEYPWIRPGGTLREAMSLLDAPRFDIVASSGQLSLPWVLLVIDEEQALLGMLRRRDIIRGLGTTWRSGPKTEQSSRFFPVDLDPNLADLSRYGQDRGMRERAERPVNDVMVRVRITVDLSDSLDKVIDSFVAFDTSLIPVLDAGKVVGVISSVDVFYEISRIVLGGGEEP